LLLINVTPLATRTNTLGKRMSHGRLEPAVAVNITLVMTISADKA
jgi:hypothetical protein